MSAIENDSEKENENVSENEKVANENEKAVSVNVILEFVNDEDYIEEILECV